MKKTLLTISFLIAAIAVFAKNPTYIGQTQFNAGLGLYSGGIPVYLGLDYQFAQDITFGGELSYRTFTDRWSDFNYHHTVVGIFGNGNYHLNSILTLPSEWDFYAGLNIGFYIWNSPSGYGGSHTSGLGIGGQIGARYFFTDRFGVNLEFGGGNVFSGGKIGITLRL